MEFKAKDIAALLSGVVDGDPEISVNNVSKIEEGKPGTLAFLANPKYEHYIYTTQASIVLVNKTFEPTHEYSCTLIRVESAYDAIATLLQMYDDMKPKPVGIEQPSYISDSATIGEKPYIGAFAYIGRGAKIGNNVKIYPQAYIGDGVVIGDNTIIYAGVKINTSGNPVSFMPEWYWELTVSDSLRKVIITRKSRRSVTCCWKTTWRSVRILVSTGLPWDLRLLKRELNSII